MSKVVIINEECHGFIGVAKNFESAAKWMIEHHWIEPFTEMWFGYDEEMNYIFSSVKKEADKRNISWEDYVLNSCVNQDDDALERMGIYLHEEELIGSED